MNSDAQAAVETMIGDHAPFETIERYIDTLPLPNEHLSALWLLAWAEATDPLTRRQIVTDALANLNDPHPQPTTTPTRPRHHRAHTKTHGRQRGQAR
jgi:hypothetical protein